MAHDIEEQIKCIHHTTGNGPTLACLCNAQVCQQPTATHDLTHKPGQIFPFPVRVGVRVRVTVAIRI